MLAKSPTLGGLMLVALMLELTLVSVLMLEGASGRTLVSVVPCRYEFRERASSAPTEHLCACED